MPTSSTQRYEGEIPELKFDCECRKPKPGLLLKAAKDYNISLKDSYIIGDTSNDILAGKNAGCKTILVREDYQDIGQDYYFETIGESVNSILSINENKYVLKRR